MHTSTFTSDSWLFHEQKFPPVQAMQDFFLSLSLSKVTLTTFLWNITQTSWLSHRHHEGQRESWVVKQNSFQCQTRQVCLICSSRLYPPLLCHQRCHCACISLMYNTLIMDSPGVVLFSHRPRFCRASCGGVLHGFTEEVIVCLCPGERSTTRTGPLNSSASSAVTWRNSLTYNYTKQNNTEPTIAYYVVCLWVRLCLFLGPDGLSTDFYRPVLPPCGKQGKYGFPQTFKSLSKQFLLTVIISTD